MKVEVFGGVLDISSVWKSLVAGCVCATEVRTCVLNVLVFSTEVSISSAKRVRVQRQKCLSPVQNVFVGCYSDKPVHLLCDIAHGDE